MLLCFSLIFPSRIKVLWWCGIKYKGLTMASMCFELVPSRGFYIAHGGAKVEATRAGKERCRDWGVEGHYQQSFSRQTFKESLMNSHRLLYGNNSTNFFYPIYDCILSQRVCIQLLSVHVFTNCPYWQKSAQSAYLSVGKCCGMILKHRVP